MKIHAMLIDANQRSVAGFVEIPMTKVSETESISARQDGVIWRIGFRHNSEHSRVEKAYSSAAGPYEMHVGGAPHFIGCMSGHAEITMQDGGAWRLAAGDFLYVAPGALHHSNNPSTVPVTIFNLYLPGTAADTKDYVFK
jgi:oxalate decarboxylase/phosphoglucose isomerase-like protein (cupin superfamily)